jgi:hypothetical protein
LEHAEQPSRTRGIDGTGGGREAAVHREAGDSEDEEKDAGGDEVDASRGPILRGHDRSFGRYVRESHKRISFSMAYTFSIF